MKVLHILDEIRFSGAETMLQSAGDFFYKSGVQSHALATGRALGDFADTLANSGYSVHHIPYESKFRQPTRKFLDTVRTYLNREQFDAIHIHPGRVYPIFAAEAYKAGIKVILYTVHHIFPQPFTLKKQAKRLVSIFHRFHTRIHYGVIHVSNSDSGWKNERKTYFSKNLLVPNWFDSNRYVPTTPARREELRKALGVSPDTFLIVSLGGNWSYKNYDLLVRGLTIIPDDVDILYIQVGPQGENAPLERLAAEIGAGHRLACAGMVPEPLDYLHAADVYAMPSQIEGFGCAAAEAMGAGIPVLLSDVPALFDFRENCPGIVYVQPNPESIAKGLLGLRAQNFERRLAIGRELSKAAHRHYGIEKGAGLYLEIYKGNIPQEARYDGRA